MIVFPIKIIIMHRYFIGSLYVRNKFNLIEVGEHQDIKIGWKDKNVYWFVKDDISFDIQAQYQIDFLFYIQNKVNTGWKSVYSVIESTPSYYSSYVNKSFQIEIFCDENRLYERILADELDYQEKEFLYVLLSNKTTGADLINSEWKKSWVDADMPLTTQPKNFKVKLFEYQLKSLKWATDIENSKYKSSFFSNCTLELISKHEDLSKIHFDMISKQFIFDLNNYKGHDQLTNGGILADEMGLGKTITSIALINKNTKIINPNMTLENGSINVTNNKVSTKATLVICPSHLTKQWELEIKKCNPNLNSILILTKTNHTKYSYTDILDKDIVIVSFQFLWNISWYVNYPYFDTPTYDSKRITNSRLVTSFKERNKDMLNLFKVNESEFPDFEVNKTFTFENINWFRIIVDEAHEIFKATQYNYQEKFLLEFINNLDSENRWFVSGTPFWNTEGFNNIMNFLNFKVIKNLSIENNIHKVKLNYQDLLNHHISFDNVKKSIFNKFYIRNTKESVKDLLNIPSAIIDTVYLKFSEFEEKLYSSLRGSYSEDYLRQICCNIQICDKFSNHELSSILNFDQVKDKILADAQEKINKTKITINSLDSTVPGYAARLQMLNNIVSSNEFLIKSFQISEDSKIKEETCPICRCEFDDPVITQCGHNFCCECITSVLEISNFKKECPICRSKIDNSKIYKLDKSDEEDTPANEIDELTYNYGTKLAKLIKLCRQILNDPNNKIIIFSQWDRLLSMIGTVLKNNEIDNVFCKGNVHQRNSAIMSFRKEAKKKNKTRIIMLSTEHAASGTNLTEATHIIFMEPIKGNAQQVKSMEDQAIGRAVRLGQENQVHVYKLIIKDTIEEDIYNNPQHNNSQTTQNVMPVNI